jgi:arsenate reductase-like glutaredoxin family protein
MKDQIEKLMNQWRRESKKLSKKSSDTWKALGTEELPQDDEIIYSVYEDQAAANTYAGCAEQLAKILLNYR